MFPPRFLPAYAVLEADERARLVDMARKIDGVTAILPLLGTETVEVAEMDGRHPGQGSAHAIIEARRRGALLARYAGERAREALPDEAILDLQPARQRR